jgi:hypothetical protein
VANFLQLGEYFERKIAITENSLPGLHGPREARANRLINRDVGEQTRHRGGLQATVLIQVHQVRICNPGTIRIHIVHRAVPEEIQATSACTVNCLTHRSLPWRARGHVH